MMWFKIKYKLLAAGIFALIFVSAALIMIETYVSSQVILSYFRTVLVSLISTTVIAILVDQIIRRDIIDLVFDKIGVGEILKESGLSKLNKKRMNENLEHYISESKGSIFISSMTGKNTIHHHYDEIKSALIRGVNITLLTPDKNSVFLTKREGEGHSETIYKDEAEFVISTLQSMCSEIEAASQAAKGSISLLSHHEIPFCFSAIFDDNHIIYAPYLYKTPGGNTASYSFTGSNGFGFKSILKSMDELTRDSTVTFKWPEC
ncbi:hypothetical protein [Magnetovibrio sp.]|uniref:hypothetical protein n=1 Tax=Magnetovibrio sp. TaxID=2024836 RepID=UPI002F920FC3